MICMTHNMWSLHKYCINLATTFGKMWKSKFDYNTNDILQVDGTSNSAVIVENFAKHFEKVCRPSSPVRNDEFKALFIKKRSIYIMNYLLAQTTFSLLSW